MNYIEDLENTIGPLIGKSYRSLSTLLQRNFKKIGYEISIDQWIILVGLFKNDGCTQQQLANFSRKDKASVARLISGLEQKQLVFRKADPTDRRNKKVHLSKRAKDIQQKFLTQVDFTIQQVLTGIDENEVEICKNVLKKIMERAESALNKVE